MSLNQALKIMQRLQGNEDDLLPNELRQLKQAWTVISHHLLVEENADVIGPASWMYYQVRAL